MHITFLAQSASAALYVITYFAFNFSEPSGTPNAIQIRILSSSSIEVQWLPPDFIDQNGVITGYTVVLNNIETGTSHEYNTSGNVTVQIIEGKLMFTEMFTETLSYLSVCLSVCLSLSLSVCLPVCLFICLSVCLCSSIFSLPQKCKYLQ